MPPKKSTNKQNNNIKKEDKNAKYKLLNNYLFSGDETILQKIISDQETAESLRNRIYSYIQNNPKILIYVNKYLNDLYKFNSYSLEDYFKTFYKIFKDCGIYSPNDIYFLKYKNHDHILFFKTIKDYYKLNEIEISNNELNCLYQLYKENIITPEYIDELRAVLDGKEVKQNSSSTIVNPTFTLTTQRNNSDIKSFENLSSPIKEFIEQCKEYITKNCSTCKYCNLRKNDKVILDTNLTEIGPVDIAIISLQPTQLDTVNHLPLSNNAYVDFNSILNAIVKKYNLSYLITYVIPCIGEKEITKDFFDKCYNSVCSIILNNFKPNLQILLGDKLPKLFGIKGAYSKLVNNMIQNKYLLPDPLTNTTKKSLDKLIEGFDNLEKILNQNQKQENIHKPKVQKNLNIRLNPDKVIQKLTNKYTLLDIKILNNQVIYILKDEYNQKKYYFEEINIPIYIKNGVFMDCTYENKDMDYVCYLNEFQKTELAKKIKNNMNKTILGV